MLHKAAAIPLRCAVKKLGEIAEQMKVEAIPDPDSLFANSESEPGLSF